jgi:hypothetical protein
LATDHNLFGFHFGMIGYIKSSNQESLYFIKDSEIQEDKEDYILVDKWIKSLDFNINNNVNK